MARRRGWHILLRSRRSLCGREPAWKDGERRSVEGPVYLCSYGYHASPHILDAMEYHRGRYLVITRVESLGEMYGDDPKYPAHTGRKWVAESRRLLWSLKPSQCNKLLSEFTKDLVREALKAALKLGLPETALVGAVNAKLRGGRAGESYYPGFYMYSSSTARNVLLAYVSHDQRHDSVSNCAIRVAKAYMNWRVSVLPRSYLGQDIERKVMDWLRRKLDRMATKMAKEAGCV